MPSQIKKSLITILLFSRWLGLSPVKWESLQLRVSKGFGIYGALLFCIIATLMANETFSVILALIQNKEIDVEINRTDLFLVKVMLKELILFGYMALKGLQRMAIIIEVLEHLEKIKEKRFRYTPENKGKKKFYYFIVSLTIFLVIVYINEYIFDVYDGEQPILENTKLFILTFCIRYACAISGFHFVLVALLIHTLLASINEDLEEIFKDNVPPSNVILYKKPVLGNRNISPTIDGFGLIPAGTFGRRIDRQNLGEYKDQCTTDALYCIKRHNPIKTSTLRRKAMQECFRENPYSSTECAAETTTENTKTDGRIRSISRTYVNYCCLARKLNDSEDIVLLIYVFKLGLNLGISLFNVLQYDDYITSGASMALVAFTLHNIIVAVTTGTQLMLFVEPSYRAQVELRKTTLLVSRALNETLERNDLDQLNELRHLLKMLHLNRPVYSAFGVFNIGRPLVTAVLSGTATILVMLQ